MSHYRTLQVKGWISIPIKAKVFAAWKIGLQSTGGTGSQILGGQTGKKSNDSPGEQTNDPSSRMGASFDITKLILTHISPPPAFPLAFAS